MNSINHYREEFLAHLKTSIAVKEPRNLYEPIDYILQLGGKRLRPVLTLMQQTSLVAITAKHFRQLLR